MEKPFENNENGVVTMKLKGELTIHNVMETKNLLVQAVKGGEQIYLDLEKVSDLDVSTLQLIYAVKEYVQKHQKHLHFTNSDILKSRILESGFQPYFEQIISGQ